MPKIRVDQLQDVAFNRDANDNITVRAGQEPGTIIFPLSSEEPYSRHYWEHGELEEVLRHDTKSIDLSFINSGHAPLLDSHRAHSGLAFQIGVVRKAWIEKKRLYVEVKFSNREDAQAVYKDVIDGVISNVSVGYEIEKYEIDEDAKTFTATRWKPKEASFVPVPADTTVGVGRSANAVIKGDTTMSTANANTVDNTPVLPGVGSDTLTDEQRAEQLTSDINEITALAEKHNMADIARGYVKGCMERGEPVNLALFRGLVASKLPDGTPLVNNDIGLTEKERQSFSILRLMRSLDDSGYKGAGFEVEASLAAREKMKRTSEHPGMTLPTDLMNDWGRFEMDGVRYDQHKDAVREYFSRAAMSTALNPNILTTDHLAERFIDNLRNTSAVLGAGATMLDGLSDNVEIPGGDQNIAAAWLASEDADAAESVPTFRKITLTPKDVAVYTDLTRRMLQQSTIAMEAYVRAQQVEGVRIAVDSAALYGSGAAGVPLGIKNVAGIGAVPYGIGITVPSRDNIIDLRTAIANTNRGRGVTYLGNSNLVGDLQKTKVDAGSGIFLMGDAADRLVGNPFNESNQVTGANLFAGVWQDLLIGMWDGLQIDRSTERKFLSGGVSFRTIGTFDFGVTRVGSFALGDTG